MDITLTTPALLFSAISLLLLAYSNRFLAIAALIRNLHSKYKETKHPNIMHQIKNLRRRMFLIRNMQAFGVMSLFLCVFCMFVLFGKYILIGKYIFGVALVFLMISLALSVWEIQISVGALNLQLRDLEDTEPN